MPIVWKIDPGNSEILFKVKHLMITTVTGRFRKFAGEAITEIDDLNSITEVHFTADTDSIDTNNEQRDTHLKSDEFFSAEKYLQVLFMGTRYETMGDEATLQGYLTIRGVTKPVDLDVQYAGTIADTSGLTRAGFIVTGKISRKQFGLNWNAVTEAGNVVAGDEIKIHAEIQLVRQH